MAELHPDVAVLAPLLGTWAGQGAGEYPTIAPFGYVEEVTFGHVGKPFLIYGQRTKATDDGRPCMRRPASSGCRRRGASNWFWRIPPASPRSRREHCRSRNDGRDGTERNDDRAHRSAKEVTALSRSIRVDGDELTYTLRMGAVGQPLQHHLAATLHRKHA